MSLIKTEETIKMKEIFVVLATSETKSFIGTGRRKSAVAQVELLSGGTGKIIINGHEATNYLQYNPKTLSAIQGPLVALGLEESYDVTIKCSGGGLAGQADAIKLGIAKSLCKMKAANREPLKAQGYLTRNSLCKERKKYGLKKARKAPQFSKR
jgi:small subunit ribosomal protein S9